MQNKVKLL